MSISVVDQIMTRMQAAEALYHRLVLVAGRSGTGKTRALQTITRVTGHRYVNVNLELSRRLLDLTLRQRALQVPNLLQEIVDESSSITVLLDNTEILFDASLHQDPLRLLQRLSRNCTVVSTWNGSIQNNYLTYAHPDHPEYRQYPISDLLVVSTETLT